jgi:hypothetical protein
MVVFVKCVNKQTNLTPSTPPSYNANWMSRPLITLALPPHMRDMLTSNQHLDVLQRILIKSDEISIIPFPQQPSLRSSRTQSQRAIRRSRLNRLQRRHASSDMVKQLLPFSPWVAMLFGIETPVSVPIAILTPFFTATRMAFSCAFATASNFA